MGSQQRAERVSNSSTNRAMKAIIYHSFNKTHSYIYLIGYTHCLKLLKKDENIIEIIIETCRKMPKKDIKNLEKNIMMHTKKKLDKEVLIVGK